MHPFRSLLPGRAGLVCCCLLMFAPAPAPAAPPASRFKAEATAQPLLASPDGRFAATVAAHFTPQARTDGGRFVLSATKAPAGGCNPEPVPLFANGFEPLPAALSAQNPQE